MSFEQQQQRQRDVPSSTMRKKMSPWRSRRFVQVILVVVGIFLFIFISSGGSEKKVEIKASDELPKEKTIIEKVSAHMELPTDEEPLLAVVQNAVQLSAERELFKDVHDDDQVILFQKNNIAVVYRPSSDKVIAIGEVDGIISNENKDASKSSEAATSSQEKYTSLFTIEVRNGTLKDGYARDIAENLIAEGYEVIESSVATRKTSTTTTAYVYARGSKVTPAIQQFIKGYNATQISNMPKGEEKSSADVVLFLADHPVASTDEYIISTSTVE